MREFNDLNKLFKVRYDLLGSSNNKELIKYKNLASSSLDNNKIIYYNNLIDQITYDNKLYKNINLKIKDKRIIYNDYLIKSKKYKKDFIFYR